MTIAKTTSRAQYSGNGSTAAFSFPYRFFADADLDVYVLVESSGVETLQVLTTHYTVSNNGDETGGTVTMITPPASGEVLTIVRSTAQTQSTDYQSNDAFPAETHEAALDRLTLLVQQLQEAVDRSITLPISDAGADTELPYNRADKFLAFDASKNLVAVSTVASEVTVSPYMETLLDDTTAVAGRDTLEISVKNLSKSADYTPVAADRSKVITCTAGMTLNLTSAATLGNGWYAFVIASGGDVIVDPAGSETINGVATITIKDGTSALVFCDGTGFSTIGIGLQSESSPKLGGNLDANGNAVFWSKGADVASAAELLVLTDGNSFDVTGTTTITSIETTSDAFAVGSIIMLQFDGALTLTHHATDLILPGGANITTAAGDVAMLAKYAAGDWRCISYQRSSGEPVVTPIASSSFVSSETAIPSGGTAATVAHGLGAIPSLVSVVLRCKTTDLGYSVGDEVQVLSSSLSGAYQSTVYADATNVEFGLTTGSTIQIYNQSTGSLSSITAGNWKLVFRAWA